MSELEELRTALRLFIGAAYPVDISINPRGHNWSEAYLDQAFAAALDALARSGQAASGSSQGARSDVQNGVGLGQPEAPTAAPLYVACHECTECGHTGINDESDAESACSMCRWHGPSPDTDVCPGCSDEGTMCSACPKCGGYYTTIAEARLAHPPARSGAKPAAERTEQEIIRDAVASVRLFRQDYCPEKIKPGGCTLHNLHCGYPKCNEPPAARSGAGSEEARDAARYRWLRPKMSTSRTVYDGHIGPWHINFPTMTSTYDGQPAEQLDTAIDAAIAASKPEAASQPDRAEGA